MPLYDYSCECGLRFEQVLTMDQCDDPQSCPACGQQARKLIALGHGGYLRPDAGWLRGVSDVLEDDVPPSKRQITSVEGYRSFLEAHPNIAPKESHPCLPSSVRDVSKPDLKAQAAKRRKAAIEKLRQKRRITVGQAA